MILTQMHLYRKQTCSSVIICLATKPLWLNEMSGTQLICVYLAMSQEHRWRCSARQPHLPWQTTEKVAFDTLWINENLWPMSLFAFSMRSRGVLKLGATELDKLDIFSPESHVETKKKKMIRINCDAHSNEYKTDTAANSLSFLENQRQTWLKLSEDMITWGLNLRLLLFINVRFSL